MKFLVAMKNTFQRPGQTLKEFAAEISALSYEDKKWYAAELNKAGIECEQPDAPTA